MKVTANRDNNIKINIGLYSLQHSTGCMPTVLQNHGNKKQDKTTSNKIIIVLTNIPRI